MHADDVEDIISYWLDCLQRDRQNIHRNSTNITYTNYVIRISYLRQIYISHYNNDICGAV